MQYQFHYDAGHAWLEVPMSEVKALGVRVSACSYRSRDRMTAYLEEDCDAPAFAIAHEQMHGCQPSFDVVYDGDNSFIRSLPSFAN